ncbi:MULTISPECIES: hypothetical protein [Gilliamella]|uniref:hypothetical protein n=1 Tax=Gilliamella TaxID=1193503 RepID=UPI000A15413C|nr:hypothetical protein [Gilliamella bombi]
MTKILALWNKQTLPIKDGIYFSTGESISLSTQFYPQLLIKKGKPFNLNLFLDKDPDNITNIDITKKITITNGNQCFLGEGSYGSEGFIAYLTPKDDLKWVIYFETSNPFINATELPNHFLIVESSADFKIVIELNNPINLILTK